MGALPEEGRDALAQRDLEPAAGRGAADRRDVHGPVRRRHRGVEGGDGGGDLVARGGRKRPQVHARAEADLARAGEDERPCPVPGGAAQGGGEPVQPSPDRGGCARPAGPRSPP
ncbi:hypothetical protein MXD60_02650 [Frankia sp. AgB32]|nr:hypothetical protein [Frankia sp. AgB32]MCK9893503.1 hypothetical protein [Frankia sp. AgB32]